MSCFHFVFFCLKNKNISNIVSSITYLILLCYYLHKINRKNIEFSFMIFDITKHIHIFTNFKQLVVLSHQKIFQCVCDSCQSNNDSRTFYERVRITTNECQSTYTHTAVHSYLRCILSNRDSNILRTNFNLQFRVSYAGLLRARIKPAKF